MENRPAENDERSPSLHPLHCPFCGGAVPFGDKETVPCAHCGEQVPIPEDHRAAARAATERNERSAAAAKIWSKVSRGGTPGPILAIIRYIALLAGISVMFPGLLLMAAAHENIKHQETFLIWFAIVEGIFLLYALLVVQSTSRSVASSTFWGALGGKPVEGKPGMYACRSCGAMLNVTKDSISVSCAYCGRDNLVGLPPERLSSIMGQARHSTLSLEAASKTIKFRKDERKFYFTTQFLLAQLILLPMLARGMEGTLDMGWLGPIGAFVISFTCLMVFGYALSMRKITKHLKESLEIWKNNDPNSEAFIMGGDYMLVVISDAGMLLDSPMSKAFVPKGTVTRARMAHLQFDVAWKEGNSKKKASFHCSGDKKKVTEWIRETSGGQALEFPGGDMVSKARGAFNAIVAISILLWIAGMIFL